MGKLLAIIECEAPLPRTTLDAVQATLKVTQALAAVRTVLEREGISVKFTLAPVYEGIEQAHAPKKRGRKPRATLGSSPLGTVVTNTPRDPSSSAGDPRAHQPQIISDGADPGPVPDFLRR